MYPLLSIWQVPGLSYDCLSDHDAQLLIIINIYLQIHKHKISTIRNFQAQYLLNLKMQLNYEMWDDIGFAGYVVV
jgi:hypothetical protein